MITTNSDSHSLANQIETHQFAPFKHAEEHSDDMDVDSDENEKKK